MVEGQFLLKCILLYLVEITATVGRMIEFTEFYENFKLLLSVCLGICENGLHLTACFEWLLRLSGLSLPA